MHRVHQSRAKILFESFCAITISASLAGAWVQTGASGLLAAAAVAALFGLIHAFGATRQRSEGAAEPRPIDFAIDQQPDDRNSGVPLDATIVDADSGAPVASGPGRPRRAKAPRKGGGRRAGAPKEAKVSELEPAEEAKVAGLALPEEAEVALPVSSEEVGYTHIEPLFEPEPFVRMPRPAFGRKAG